MGMPQPTRVQGKLGSVKSLVSAPWLKALESGVVGLGPIENPPLVVLYRRPVACSNNKGLRKERICG